MLILLNKPFNVLCQFTDKSGRATLADYVDVPNVYPAGLLDFDSEGLVVLTDDGRLQARIADPRFKLAKRYWVQVEGEADEAALAQLRAGVWLKDKKAQTARKTLPAEVRRIAPPALWPRKPPVRFVAGNRHPRRTQPPGAADDGSGRPANAAFGTGAGW